jgi:hypothetical protein
MRRNLLAASIRCQPLLSNIPGSFSWILLTLLAMAGMVALAISNLPMTPVVQASKLPAMVDIRIATQGFDAHHRSLPFTVYVLTQQLSWKLESADDLEGGKTMLSPELILAINDARDVFCVGTASFEGATQTEEERAAQRAGKLAQWVRVVIGNPGHTRLFTLNAGQYKGPSELVSSYQRKAIILVTGPHADEVNLSEGLTSGLEREQRTSPIIYDLLHHYSRSKEWLKMSNDPR